MSDRPTTPRVLSGMRPTGSLHLGHYHGVLKNWVRLQSEYDCFFFVADWHALTTEYADTAIIAASCREMVIDWLAAGVDPELACLFIQSRVPQHAELHVVLSMMTPLSWLERVPSYKDQQQQLKDKDLGTYGFLGYPLLQSADILAYKAAHVPVGEDQVAHVELTREIARRFNHLYGREPGYETKIQTALGGLSKNNRQKYRELRRQYQEQGHAEAQQQAYAIIDSSANLSSEQRQRLRGDFDGSGRSLLPEPEALLTPASKMPGLDGRKMSKSYANTIAMREAPESVEHKLRTMPTDPARARRTDPGEPEKCPVWQFHLIYSPPAVQEWVQQGCRSAGIGCLDCKRPVIEAVIAETTALRERAEPYIADPNQVRAILAQGCENARVAAGHTLDEVRAAIGLGYGDSS